MTTIVNSPTPAPSESSGLGGISFLIGIIVLVAFVMLLLYFGIPAIQRMTNTPIQFNVPATQIVVPDKVDLNITKSE